MGIENMLRHYIPEVREVDRLKSRQQALTYSCLVIGDAWPVGKMLSFPDSYLLRGLLTLVAISWSTQYFGVAPPRWFDRGTPNHNQVPAGKTDPPSTVIGQSATLVSRYA